MLKQRLSDRRLWMVFVSVGVVILVGFQVAPVAKSNPPVIQEPQWDSPQTRELVQTACFDCHSNETVYPWYANIGPTRVLVRQHVNEGRDILNFSEWGGQEVELDEIMEVIQEGEMPPMDYRLMHPSANLSDDEKAQLIAGFRTTFGASSSEGEFESTETDDEDDDEG